MKQKTKQKAKAMYDVTIFSNSWPRGLLVAQKLHQAGKKVCYVELLPNQPSPFGVLLGEYSESEKQLLQSAGRLVKQDVGFCLLSPKGSWSFQDMEWQKQAFSKKQNNAWLSFLSYNLMCQFFDSNNDCCKQTGYVLKNQKMGLKGSVIEVSDNKKETEVKGLNFYSDYFFFYSSTDKKQEFMKQYPLDYKQIQTKDLKYLEDKQAFLIGEEEITSSKFLWLSDYEDLFPLFDVDRQYKPEWQWACLSFKADIASYNDIIPHHFVSLKSLSRPWVYANLLSVFRNGNHWDVWFKKAYGREDTVLPSLILDHLHTLFKGGVHFELSSQKNQSSFPIYSGDHVYSRDHKKDNKKLPKWLSVLDFHSCCYKDLANQLRYEKQWLEDNKLSFG